MKVKAVKCHKVPFIPGAPKQPSSSTLEAPVFDMELHPSGVLATYQGVTFLLSFTMFEVATLMEAPSAKAVPTKSK